MAVSVAAPPADHHPVRLRHFARLKIRLLANGFRGKPYRVVSFLIGVIAGLYLAGMGFFGFAISAVGDAPVQLMVASLGGGLLVVGSALLPLIWFGVDDTLDPARFALLPLSRWRLVSGLLAAALIGVPGIALLLATTGLLIPAAVHGGLAAALLQLVGIGAALLLCLTTARAVTTAFASTLRSRRVRDLLWVFIACIAALLGPLQLVLVSAIQRAQWDQLTLVAEVVGWTPLGAPYTVGYEVAQGRPLVALAKLAITAVAIATLLWWWGRTLESALAGASSGGKAGTVRASRGGVTSQLLPRLVPGLSANAFGALVARDIRYWWRDARRRSSLIMTALVGAFVPLLFTTGLTGITATTEHGFQLSFGEVSPGLLYGAMVFVGALAASAVANLFGYDGTAYATHLVIGVSGRRELQARVVAHAVLMLPVLLVIGALPAVVHGTPALAPGAWGVLFGAYGVGLALNQYLSVTAAYAMPETSNPFATGSGDAVAKSLLAMLALFGTVLLAIPLLVGAMLMSGAWPWIGPVVGTAYGMGAALLASRLAGGVLDRRAPEVLAAVTPRR